MSVDPAVSKAKRRWMSRDTKYMYLFISPWIIGFVLFMGGPIVALAYYSLTSYDMSSPPQWIGLKNYTDLVTDPLFWKSLRVTGIYTLISVPVGQILSLLVAILVNMKLPFQRFFRTAVYFPTLVSGVSLSLLWLWLLNPQFGVINYLIYAIFHVQGPSWLFSVHWVMPSLIFMSFFGIGSNMVLYIAALQGVPTTYYEAADIDSAGRWHKFWHITLPMISPTTLFLLITNIINTAQVFTQASVMTKGGPDYASYFYVYNLIQQAFANNQMGYASAMSWILLVFSFILTVVLMQTSKRWVHYQ